MSTKRVKNNIKSERQIRKERALKQEGCSHSNIVPRGNDSQCEDCGKIIMSVPVRAFTDSVMPHQRNFLHIFDSGKYHTYMLNWHRRARKTTMCLNLIFRECCKYPNRTYAYVAPTLKQGKKIVWLDPNMLHTYLPKSYVEKINETDMYVKFKNGSMFTLLGSEDEDAVRGTNAHGYIIDEWGAYSNPDVWNILRPILTDKRARGLDPWTLFIFTPKGRNHAFEMWNSCPQWEGWYRNQLTVEDTKLVPENIIAQERKEMPPSLFKQEYYCDFTSDDERTVISWDVVDSLKSNILVNVDKRKFVVCDPSLGGDACPIMCFEGSKVVKKKLLVGERNAMVVVGEIIAMMNAHGTQHLVIDANGLGEGIASRVAEQGYIVHDIRSSEKVREDTKYFNKRAEMHFYVLNEMVAHRVAPIDDKDIMNQLTSIRYKPMDSSGRIKLEKKEDTKSRIGRSPDDSDCYVMGIYELPNIPKYDYADIDKWRRPIRQRKRAYAGGANGY